MSEFGKAGSKAALRRAAAIASVIAGGILLVAGGQNLLIRAVGLVFMLGAANLHRDARSLAGLPVPSARMWIAGFVSVGLALVAYQLLYLDALNGYHQVWPVYVFGLAGLITMTIWGALAARLPQ